MKKTVLIMACTFLLFNNAFSDAPKFDSPFVSFPSTYQMTGPVIEINMPPVRSQDSIGLCYSFVSSGLLDKYQCVKNRKDCRNINQSERVSVLALAQGFDDKDNPLKSIKVGGLPYSALVNLLYSYSGAAPNIAKESCAPFDSIVNKYSDADKTQDKTFKWLEDVFNKVKSKEINCIDCVANEVQALFPGLMDKNRVVKSFSKPDFGQFLFSLAVPDRCMKIENQIIFPDDLQVEVYPDEAQKTATSAQIKTKIIEILKIGKPLALNGICMDQKKEIPDILNCQSYHAVVVTGYSTKCSPKGKCHEAFKVLNSWGESWQRAYSDGWVLADQLTGRVGGVFGAINWIE